MKSFQQLREGKLHSKKIKGVQTSVKKKGNKFVAVIDGDVLDEYKSEAEAIKMIELFMKTYKG